MARGRILFWLFFGSINQFQIVIADVESAALQYIARHLIQNECQRILPESFSAIPRSSESRRSSPNEIDCLRKLVEWESNLRIDRRDANLILGNRLHKIGRDDLAALLVNAGPLPEERDETAETVEYESWDSRKNSNKKLVSSSAAPIPETGRIMAPEFRQQLIRKLNGMHSLDGFRDRSMAMVEPESEHSETLGGEYVTSAGSLGNHQGEEDVPGTSVSPTEINNVKDSKSAINSSAKKPPVDEKHDKTKFSKILSHFSDEKNAPCLRVPLSTALVVIGTIMSLTCCCALLLRNRLAACFERLRGKTNKNKTSKRTSLDEEQGFMGPRTFGKVAKKNGTKGGGPIDVTNVGIQNSNTASNGSIESEEKPTGCCTCCAKKKKNNRRKRKR